MNRIIFSSLGILLALVSFRCNNNLASPTGLDSPFLVFSGKVMDMGGGAAAGVSVHYMFHLDPSPSAAPLSKSLPTTTIEFCLTEDATVTVTLLRYGTRRFVATLVDHEAFDAGCQEVEFNANGLTNGLYLIHIDEGSVAKEFIIALLNTDITSLIQTTPLTVTDAQGNFSIPYSSMGIGAKLVTTNDGVNLYEVRISQRIEVVLYKVGYEPLIATVNLTPGASTDAEFRLQ